MLEDGERSVLFVQSLITNGFSGEGVEYAASFLSSKPQEMDEDVALMKNDVSFSSPLIFVLAVISFGTEWLSIGSLKPLTCEQKESEFVLRQVLMLDTMGQPS